MVSGTLTLNSSQSWKNASIVVRAENTMAVWSRMLILWARNSLDDNGSILKNGWNSNTAPYFSSMLEYGDAVFGCCCDIRIFFPLITPKK